MSEHTVGRYLTIVICLTWSIWSASKAVPEELRPREIRQEAEYSQREYQGSHATAPFSPFAPIWIPKEAAPQIIQIITDNKAKEGARCTKGDSWREILAFWWCEAWAYVSPEQMTALFTVILGISTIGLWSSTRRLSRLAAEQSRDMKASIIVAQESAIAAKKSTDVAERTLTISQRAWIKVEIDTVAQAVIKNDKISVNIGVSIKNTGNSPATNISIYIWLFIESGGEIKFTDWSTEKFEMVRGQLKVDGMTLFPNDVWPNDVAINSRCANINVENIQAGLNYGEKYSQDGFVLRIAGCVNYSFATDEKFHQTRFYRTLDGRNGGWISLDEIRQSGTFGAAKFRVDNHFGWGDYAD